MARIFDRELDCGCLVSSDGGGAVIPCYYDELEVNQTIKCKKAWAKWKKTKDYLIHLKECDERNQ